MTRSITVAVPDEELLRTLGPLPDGVTAIVWDVDDAPLAQPVDLLVLRYMIRPEALRALADVTVSVVQSQTLGYDGVHDTLPPGITYCNAPDVHEASTAELTLALILSSQRGLAELRDAQRESQWRHAQYPGLAGKRVVLLGVGGVGTQIADRLAPFDVGLVRVARSARRDETGEIHGLDELPAILPSADVVILAVPLTEETRGLASTGFLSLLSPGALLVNVSRGAVVDTDALVAAVRGGGIRAAVDVTDPEPLPADHPLWTLPGVIVTPHVGGHTDAMHVRVRRVIREQLELMQAGKPPAHIVIDGRQPARG